IVQLLDEKRYKDIVKMLLANEGLGYGQLPKGLLLFHKYGNNSRTAFEEHLVEGALYAKEADGVVNIHFTVSEEHQALFEKLKNEVLPKYESLYKVNYNI